jgi:hypothetical protein
MIFQEKKRYTLKDLGSQAAHCLAGLGIVFMRSIISWACLKHLFIYKPPGEKKTIYMLYRLWEKNIGAGESRVDFTILSAHLAQSELFMENHYLFVSSVIYL